MKKALLLLGAAAAVMPAMAGVEPANTYQDIDGLKCVNIWNFSRNLNSAEFTNLEFAAQNNKIRSSVVIGDQVIFGYSKTIITGEGESASSEDHCFLLKHNLYTGAFEELLELTLNGQPITGLLPINQVGVDDFGNLWFAPVIFDSQTKPIPLYRVKDIKTGECELVAELTYPDEDKNFTEGVTRRHDYYDLVGDVTGEKAGTVFMTAVASDKDEPVVLCFKRAMGSSEWGPGMSGDEYYANRMSETYPADQASWNGAPMVRIVRDEEHSGANFYVDAFVTCPTLYDTEGTMLDSFAACTDIQPKVGPNGCIEFKLDDKDYFVFALRDYDTDPGSSVRVARFGEGMQFEGMTAMWDIPANGFGTITDTGSRMFAMNPVNRTDSKGNNAVYLALAKLNGGLACYRISGPEFQSDEFEKAGVNDVIADDANAPEVYYNLNGVRVNGTPAPGLYIVKQGSKVSKQIVK